MIDQHGLSCIHKLNNSDFSYRFFLDFSYRLFLMVKSVSSCSVCALCGADIIKHIANFSSLIKELKHVLRARPHT